MADYLDGTVDEVKEKIRDASDVNYEELLKEEEQGKDRKTVKEFLEKKIGEEVEEEIHEEVEEQEEVEEELVEEIEEETSEGLLGSFNRVQLVSGGALFGIIAGLLVGSLLMPSMGGDQISQTQATEKVEDFLVASGQPEDQISVTAEPKNNMYYINASVDRTVNGTQQTQSQMFYLTTDGKILFPEQVRSPFGAQNVAYDIDQLIQRAQQAEQQPENQTGNNQTTNTTQ
ncbi:hypothetical protein [Candidatus Nanohalobium constans]|uniref:Uncharacterized protein n=1 Tax=Candidatus Nanohalobium constans TaxID=2565781 RepID=A0A5Q0UFM0_9ARCH|nr:hypothetical protein [Candidatus Nanohalobium constans]QGA80413.1 hypothetical protein LC1Nh_0513 [Candidatus Nanohalobium constans]